MINRMYTYPPSLIAVDWWAGGLEGLKSAFATMGGGAPGVLGMLLAFGALVTVHEFGHWAVAKALGFRTPVFCVGWGTRKWSLVLGTWLDTEWRIAIFPLGGFVSIPEIGDENATPEDLEQARQFATWKKIAVAAAGPGFNALAALLLIFGAYAYYGQPALETRTYVESLSPVRKIAEVAGVKVADRFESVGGVKVHSQDDVVLAFQNSANKPVDVVFDRAGSAFTAVVTPEEGGRIGVGLGSAMERVFHRQSTPGAAVLAFGKTAEAIEKTVMGFGMALHIVEKPVSVKQDLEVRGLIFMINTGADALESNTFNFIWYVAIVSIGLAVLNIMPIPLLDGSHIATFLIEGVTGRTVSEKVRGRAAIVGALLLIGLTLLGTFNDIKHLVFG